MKRGVRENLKRPFFWLVEKTKYYENKFVIYPK
jgi:hypothetical protein